MTTSVNTARTGTGSSGAPFAGVGTFAQMKALVSPSDGIGFLVTNYGRGGSMWRYSAANTDWFPTAPVLIYENTALVSGLVQAATQILLAMPAEANLLANKVFKIEATWAKNGGTDTLTPQIYFGALGTTADHLYTTVGGTVATANRSMGTESWFRLTSATAGVRIGGIAGSAFSGAQSAGTQVANAAVVFDAVTSANFVSLGCTMSGTTDTPQIGYVGLWVMP